MTPCITCTELSDVEQGGFEPSDFEQRLDRIFDRPFDAVKFSSRPGGFAASMLKAIRGQAASKWESEASSFERF